MASLFGTCSLMLEPTCRMRHPTAPARREGGPGLSSLNFFFFVRKGSGARSVAPRLATCTQCCARRSTATTGVLRGFIGGNVPFPERSRSNARCGRREGSMPLSSSAARPSLVSLGRHRSSLVPKGEPANWASRRDFPKALGRRRGAEVGNDDHCLGLRRSTCPARRRAHPYFLWSCPRRASHRPAQGDFGFPRPPGRRESSARSAIDEIVRLGDQNDAWRRARRTAHAGGCLLVGNRDDGGPVPSRAASCRHGALNGREGHAGCRRGVLGVVIISLMPSQTCGQGGCGQVWVVETRSPTLPGAARLVPDVATV